MERLGLIVNLEFLPAHPLSVVRLPYHPGRLPARRLVGAMDVLSEVLNIVSSTTLTKCPRFTSPPCNRRLLWPVIATFLARPFQDRINALGGREDGSV
jgi:hypothetical protein